jgi:deoxycytidine triphosphate deaminase
MLTADGIKKLIRSGELTWRGDLRGDGLLLRLGAALQCTNRDTMVDSADQDSIDRFYGPVEREWTYVDLARDQLMLCHVSHTLCMDDRHAGAIGTLSHLARLGLATHVTSPWVLPGWRGSLTLELHNVGPAVLRLHRGMPVARLLLFAMSGQAADASGHRFYGSGDQLGSRYASEFPTSTYGG